MRLVYKVTGNPVLVGDRIQIDNQWMEIIYFAKPHKPESSGKVTVKTVNGDEQSMEYYVGVIGAYWMEREDQ